VQRTHLAPSLCGPATQVVPKKKPTKDAKYANTIQTGAQRRLGSASAPVSAVRRAEQDYIDFLAVLEKEVEPLPSAEKQLEEREAKIKAGLITAGAPGASEAGQRVNSLTVTTARRQATEGARHS
jgi:hypothetical protein